MRFRIVLLSLAASTLLPALAFAKKTGDWLMEKKLDPNWNISTCVASTNATVVKSELPVSFEMIFSEQDLKTPLYIVKVKGLVGAVTRAWVRPNAKEAWPLYLMKAATTPEEEDVFVLSPLEIRKTTQAVIEKSVLDVFFGEGPSAKLIRVSLRGSTATLEKARLCRTSKVLASSPFLLALEKDAPLAPSIEGTPDQLIEKSHQALLQYLAVQNLRKDLETLQKANSPLLQKEKVAQQNVDDALAREIRTQTRVNELQKQIAEIEAKMAMADSEITRLKNERVGAQADLEAKKAIYQPLLNEVNKRENRIDEIESLLRSINSQIASNESRREELRSLIPALQNEADSLKNQIPRIESDLRDLDRKISDLESEIRRFDVRRRADEILRSDWGFQQAVRDEQNLRSQWQQAQNQVQTAQFAYQNAVNALNACRASQPPSPSQGQAADPAQQGPSCQNEEAQVNATFQQLQNAQAQASFVQRQLDQARWRIDNSIRQANDQAQRELDQLNQQRQSLDRQIADLRSQKNRAEDRISTIERQEIPSARNEIRSIESRLVDLRQRRITVRDQLASAEADLASYKVSVNFDSIENDFKQARDRVASIDKQIALFQKLLKEGPKQLVQLRKDLGVQQTELSKRAQVRMKAESALKVIQDQLIGFRTQEAELTNKIETESVTLRDHISNTQGLDKALRTKASATLD